jgi:hypothetical protein
MVIQALALLLFVAFLLALFRFAMGLRHAKGERERERAAEEARGRRVVAEIPLSEAELVLFVDDGERFRWASASLAKEEVVGARCLVNGAVAREFALGPGPLPPLSSPEEVEGGERWEVVVYRRRGDPVRIPCGSLREGVSREIAGRIFEALRAGAGAAGAGESIDGAGSASRE